MTDSIYFAPLLPWQQSLWSQMTERVLTPPHNLPHALLAAGMAGMGKRAFVWRFVAWLLCHQQASHRQGACGHCESCQWLKSGTHPSLQVLPLTSMPLDAEHDNVQEGSKSHHKKSNSSSKPAKSASKTLVTIKVDDIRALQPFIHQGGQGVRICVLDYAEQMTVAAANALLKTLEEPQAQVHLFLLSDTPSKLLPTIKSRVQQLPLQHIEPSIAADYVQQALGSTINREAVSPDKIQQLLQLANGAPLAAIALAKADWYSNRALWLTTWQALRSGKRSSLAASDYWQQQLTLSDFIKLTELMLLDIRRINMGLASIQNDTELPKALAQRKPTEMSMQTLVDSLQQIKISLQQNVQEKFAYDKLMQALVML
ncbi:DNA polymerase III subunit delta' [Psychrobacter sp. 1U2]|uniref:DNA polymerase III subunit delta' n=1 Tax=Psychrobacter sp. 1U2 TaxID=3453577 RepID=UPI003F468E99